MKGITMAGGNPLFNSKTFQSDARGGTVGFGTAAAQQTVQQNQMSAQQLQDMYNQPAAGPLQTGRMTINDVVAKTLICFALVIIGAAVGWQLPALMLPAVIIGLVLGLVNSFKREVSPVLVALYAAAEGIFLGGISGVFESMYPGIVMQAVLATFSVFAVTLVLYRSGKYRATPRMTKMFMIAMIGYLVFSLLNLVLMLTGAVDGMFGLRSGWIGLAIGALAVLLATYSLVLDFTQIQEAVAHGAPEKFAWRCAFGLTVTMVWLYVEILRILAILRGDD